MRKAAVFTIQHDEDFFLPIWLKYYEEHFDAQDIYVLSHNCTELTREILEDAEGRGVNVERINTNEIFNHEWLLQLVHSQQRKLLEDYEYVLFVDCDEIVAPVNESLKSFINNATEDAYRCVGYETITYNLIINTHYDKTLLTKIPLSYVWGYHTAKPKFPVNYNLHLYHLHRLDYEKAWERNLRLAKEKWNKESIDGELSIQNQLSNKEDFDKYFYSYYEGKLPRYTDTLIEIIGKIYKNINEIYKN
jgi:hypothetical protein